MKPFLKLRRKAAYRVGSKKDLSVFSGGGLRWEICYHRRVFFENTLFPKKIILNNFIPIKETNIDQ